MVSACKVHQSLPIIGLLSTWYMCICLGHSQDVFVLSHVLQYVLVCWHALQLYESRHTSDLFTTESLDILGM